MKIIKLKIECQSCGGSGVYQGMAERDGASVVCHTCDGTGCEDYVFKYEPFKKRVIKKGVKRVFLSGYGYCVGVKPITFDNGITVDFSKEGVSYEEFLQGKMPEHIKCMGCPMSADQSACHDIVGFVDECERLHGEYLGLISKCNNQPNKLKCWERFKKDSR